MGGTLVAIFKAVRAIYVVLILVGTLAFLFPGLGLYEHLEENIGGRDRLFQSAIGLALLGVFIEHIRGQLMGKRQSVLARALLRNQPEARREEAIRILIRALDSHDQKVVGHAHRELKRLTQTDLGTDSTAWRRWLEENVRTSTEKEATTPKS